MNTATLLGQLGWATDMDPDRNAAFRDAMDAMDAPVLAIEGNPRVAVVKCGVEK